MLLPCRSLELLIVLLKGSRRHSGPPATVGVVDLAVRTGRGEMQQSKDANPALASAKMSSLQVLWTVSYLVRPISAVAGCCTSYWKKLAAKSF